jgi:hypothetical protein
MDKGAVKPLLAHLISFHDAAKKSHLSRASAVEPIVCSARRWLTSVYYHLLYVIGNGGSGGTLDWIWDGAGTSLFCTNAHTLYLCLYRVDDGACERRGEACIYFNVTMKDVNFDTVNHLIIVRSYMLCRPLPEERAMPF